MSPYRADARPPSCPAEGLIPAFDAGWNAHEVGLDRTTVEVLTPASGKAWALLGYDTRAAYVGLKERA